MPQVKNKLSNYNMIVLIATFKQFINCCVVKSLSNVMVTKFNNYRN